jgi:hypothetical protein
VALSLWDSPAVALLKRTVPGDLQIKRGRRYAVVKKRRGGKLRVVRCGETLGDAVWSLLVPFPFGFSSRLRGCSETALEAELEALFNEQNTSDDATSIPSTYLRVRVTR